MLTAQITLIDPDDRRRGAPRSPINRPSTLRFDDGAPHSVEIEDLSATGFSFVSAGLPATIGARVRVGLDGAGRVEARVVRHDRARTACRFEPALTTAQLADAFTSETVVESGLAAEPRGGADPEPAVATWPGAVRLATLLLGVAASWTALLLTGDLIARAFAAVR